jgi:DNA-binding transcriptional LysR family regulator
MNLSACDLNLLVVFDALMRERSVTRAAAQVGLSQPAMSHALRRLRDMLHDDLFVRMPTGMIPTPRAEELAPTLRQALDAIERAFEAPGFDPALATREFSVALDNRAALALAAPLVLQVSEAAPGVTLRLRPSGTLDLAGLLDRGELDLAVVGDAHRAVGERFGSRQLFEDVFVLVMRSGHPAQDERPSLPWLAGLQHLEISSSGDDIRFLDVALAAKGLARRVVLSAPYLSAPALLTQSDMVAVVGQRVAAEFARVHPVAIKPLPRLAPDRGADRKMDRTAAAQAVMIWHRRSNGLPAHRWLRGLLQAVAGRI